jgi:hypothetical protein
MKQNKAELHRQKISSVVKESTFEHQRIAAQRTFNKFEEGASSVIIAAEMQSGKSGIALALACMQRSQLSDSDICDRKQLKDTLYLVTMADIALFEQAAEDLKSCPNVVVSNFQNFRLALKTHFKHQAPKLIIIDECHYGSSTDAVRYSKVFDFIKNEAPQSRIAFISATPFSAMYSAGTESILRKSLKTALVFHKTSSDYHGIRQMHRHQQIVKLNEDQRYFNDDSIMRRRFIKQYLEHAGTGWALIRVPNNCANKTKELLVKSGIDPAQIYIIGQKLNDVDDADLSSINDFRRAYSTAELFDEKLIAITVASFRAGINFGQPMKEQLIATWDSTIANIAAVVQANIGRACGYHQNVTAKHYTNLDAVRAYSDLLTHLEENADTNDFEGLHQIFEDICQKYAVRGFDRGVSIAPQVEYKVSKKKDDSQTYLTDSFLVVPGKLTHADYDYSQYTQNPVLLAAINLIRAELLKDDGPHRKQGRALRGEHQNWIKAQWVNGVTFDDHTPSCAKNRAIEFTSLLNQEQPVEFNKIVNPGGGEATEDKKVMASIFSVYNLSRQMDAFKRSMDEEDMAEIAQLLGIEADNTLILLYLRGDYSSELTSIKQEESAKITSTKIRNNSIF